MCHCHRENVSTPSLTILSIKWWCELAQGSQASQSSQTTQITVFSGCGFPPCGDQVQAVVLKIPSHGNADEPSFRVLKEQFYLRPTLCAGMPTRESWTTACLSLWLRYSPLREWTCLWEAECLQNTSLKLYNFTQCEIKAQTVHQHSNGCSYLMSS